MPSDNPVVLVSQLLQKHTQDGVRILKPTALERTNPGTFLQTGHYLPMDRGTQKALERGSKADTFPWEGTPKQGVSTLWMLWWRTQSWHSTPQSLWADRDGGTAPNQGVTILYIKKAILSQQHQRKEWKQTGHKPGFFCKSSFWSYCLIHNRHTNYAWF